jgi:TonB family protein
VTGAIERRLPLQDVSYPAGLSLLLHGLLALIVVYSPQWLRGRAFFKVPVSYEVTLVAPFGGGGQPKASLSLPPGPKVASAPSKAPTPPPPVAQPRDFLTLPSAPRPVVPQAAVRPLPPPTRTDEMTLPAKRPLPERRAPAPLAPPPPLPMIVAPRPAPHVAQIVPPAVTPPPSLTVVKTAPLRSVSPPYAVPLPTTPTVIVPQVAPPPPISQPVITPPVVTLPKISLGTSKEARLEAKAVKPATVAPPTITAPAFETQGRAGAGQGLGVGTETGVTVGNTDPALAYYIVLIQEKIEGNWTPPKRAPGTVGTVVISFRIRRSGQVRDLAIDSSSEDRHLDDSALRALRLASPLPPLPPLYKEETLFLRVRFNYEGVMS